MSFRAFTKVDEGAHGDVYKGEDSFDRPVAIKFIRPSVGNTAFVLEQARALARVKSPNVVAVHAIEKVKHPESEKFIQAIVMEWVDGDTLAKVIEGPLLSLAEVRRIGLGIIDGLAAIHAAKIVHSDLHVRNVLVAPDTVKIIDILYYDTLAGMPTATRAVKYRADCRSLHSLLRLLMSHCHIEQRRLDSFLRDAKPDAAISEIRESFNSATDPFAASQLNHLLQRAIKRVTDPLFLDSVDYAEALSQETDDKTIVPLLFHMIEKGLATLNHGNYLLLLWKRLLPDYRMFIAAALANAIDKEIPDGNWMPHLCMLSGFRRTGWELLPAVTRLRLESLIVADLLKGRIDINAVFQKPTGIMGLFLKKFYRFFTKRQPVIDNLCQLLNGSWFTQNYVAEHFLKLLPKLAETPDDRDKFIAALTKAYKNDSRTLKNNFDHLPKDWRTEVLAVKVSKE